MGFIDNLKKKAMEAANSAVDRKSIPADVIDEAQKLDASEKYRKKVYNRFYSKYKEKPFISLDREKYTNWLDQVKLFPEQSLVSQDMMTRLHIGLLPGHIYMLYWLDKYTNKRIPVYFEYKYGICFEKEVEFLTNQGYLENRKPTEKGYEAMQMYNSIIKAHSAKS